MTRGFQMSAIEASGRTASGATLFRLCARGAAIAILLGAGGCAHMINVAPPLNTLEAEGIAKSSRSIGYYIAPAERTLKVTTPGGGGDKVSYTPYADVEPALKNVLERTFTSAVSLDSPDVAQAIAQKNVAFVLLPKITTDSSSKSAFTWPPTHFEITLDCRIVGADGATVWQGIAKGAGEAEFADFKHDFSLAARRASKAAFLDLQTQLAAAPALR